MHTRTRVRAAVALVVLLLLPLQTRADPAPQIIISEVNWAGSTRSTADEWIELANVGATEVDVSGWKIVGATGTAGTEILLPDGTTLAPYTTYLIANYADTDTRSTLAIVPNLVTTAVSLANDKLLLQLTNAAGTVIDTAGDNTSPAGGTSGSAGYASMERTALTDGSLDASWTTTSSTDGFDAGVVQTGTPGVCALRMTEPEPKPEPEPEVVSEPDPLPEPEMVEEPETSEIPAVVEVPTETATPTAEEAPAVETTESSGSPAGLPEQPASSGWAGDPNGSESAPTDTEESSIPPTPDPQPPEPETSVDLEEEATSGGAGSASDGETIEETPITYPEGTLVINEFVSDPISGEQEWIEIYNPQAEAIPLADWSVEDSSSTATPLPNKTLETGAYTVIEAPKGKLNNDGDMITLLDPTGKIIDTVIYGTEEIPAVADPKSVARTEEGTWEATTEPTPGTKNVFIKKPETTSTTSTPTSPTKTKTPKLEKPTEPKSTIPTTPTNPATIEKTLRLSELYPNTGGNDLVEEFIEIENMGTHPVELVGWILEDASGKQYVFKEGVTAPGAFTLVTRPDSKITLNNDADTLRLIAPDGDVINEVRYDQAEKGISYARIGDLWEWSRNPTPDEPNTLPAVSLAEDGESGSIDGGTTTTTIEDAASERPSDAVRSLNAGEVLAQEDGESVRIEGVVSALPGVLGSQFFYVEDSTGGIQIYKYDADFPQMDLGDRVSLTGTLSTVRGERRIKIGAKDELFVIGSGAPPKAREIALGSLNDSLSGRLIRVTGMLAKRSGNDLALEDSGAEATVRIQSGTGISASAYTSGTRLAAQGILVPVQDGWRILPRSAEDLTEVPSVAATPTATVTTTTDVSAGKEVQAQGHRSTGLTLVLLTLGALAAFGLRKAAPYIATYVKNHPLRFTTQKAH